MSTVEDPLQDTSGSFNNTTFKSNGIKDVFAGNFKESNDYELPFNDEDEFDDLENGGLGLVMDVRSTTFRDLAEMIPRGYGDINDLSKKEEEIITNDRSNFDVNGSSSPSHDPLEEMKIRNQEKWNQVGYDPKAGRGNMKMSITLSNFKPSAIIQKESISSNSSINTQHTETKNNEFAKNMPPNQNQQASISSTTETDEYSTHVLQSYSMCLKPAKQVQRANSSNNPSTFIEAESNSDDNDAPKLKSSSEERIPAANLNTAALLASFQPLDEDLQAPEHSEELNTFNNTQNFNNISYTEDTDNGNSSSEYASNSVTDQQESDSNSIFNDGEDNHKKDMDKHKENKISNEKFFVPKMPQSPNSSLTSGESKSYSDNNRSIDSNKNDDLKSGKKVTQAQCGYDYCIYDDPNFDYKAASKNVPPDLLKLVKYPKTGIVFRALCGQSMSQYPKGVAQYVIADLKAIHDDCVSKNMVSESVYVSNIINSINSEIGALNLNKKESFVDSDESLYKRQQYWANQKSILNSEKEFKLQEIELRYQDELENLEIQWNNDRKRTQISKPSAQLIVLRQSVQANLAAKRFQEAAHLASKAEKLDKAETELAAQRIRQAYSAAAERLKQKYENERKALFQSFEAKKLSLEAQEENDLKSTENNNQQSSQSNDASSNFPTSNVSTRRSISVMSKTPGNYGPIIKKPVIKAPKIQTQGSSKLKLSMLKPNT